MVSDQTERNGSEIKRYKSRIYNAVGSRWGLKVEEHLDTLKKSVVVIQFTVNSDGKLSKLKVVQRSDNSQVLETICLPILENLAPFAPFSKAIRDEIGDSFVDEVSFNISP